MIDLPQRPRLLAAPLARALHAGQTQTYIERDLRDLSVVDSLPGFRRLMRATRTASGREVDFVVEWNGRSCRSR